MRWPLLAVAVVAGCGRLDFDPGSARSIDAPLPDDAGGLDFGAGCLVGLALDEPTWSSAAGEVVNQCDKSLALAGRAVAGARRVDDPVRGRTGEFPAPSGCVQIASSPALHATTELTLSAWVFPTALDAVNPYGVIAKRTDYTVDDAEYTMFLWTDNTVWVDLDSRNDRAHGNAKLVNNQWQMITVTYDGAQPTASRIKIYVNGALDAVLAETSATLTAYDNPLSIGCLPELPPTKPQIALAGRLDDVGVWARAFTARDVAAWYAATLR